VFNFNTFSLLRPTQPGDPSDGTLYGFTGGNWAAKTEFFQDSLLDSPMFTDVRSHSGAVEAIGYGVQFGYAPWPDFQGVVRVTALSGTFKLDGMRCDEVVNGGYYSTGWIEPVPEPSAIGVMSLGLVVVCARSKLRRKLDRTAGNTPA
jgi:PEP-CTERM motif